MKYVYKYRLIVDRHTNFRLGKKKGLNPYGYFFDFISDFSLRNADVTIVTNDHFQKIVKDKGGRGFVLEDLLTKFTNLKKQTLIGRFNAVFICTYAADEPYNEVIEAAKLLPDDLHIYITGKIPKKLEFRTLPNNVFLTGFLPEDAYICQKKYIGKRLMAINCL